MTSIATLPDTLPRCAAGLGPGSAPGSAGRWVLAPLMATAASTSAGWVPDRDFTEVADTLGAALSLSMTD